ncbi:MAG: hypothetical protein M1813_002737 [Trichoglossum hirsutum]|nr:MAG: hypothetical protein M1813_002737 [Trichoglossum hirsutum]
MSIWVSRGAAPDLVQINPTEISSRFGLELIASGESPNVDIIAVHGLDGTWNKTWTAENGVFWLRDLIPQLIPDARVFSYGELVAVREETETLKRPIIFITHSLGGLVVKSAMIHSDSARPTSREKGKSIALSTSGILFLGTPHRGGQGTDMGLFLAQVDSIFTHTSSRIIKHLAENSEWLQMQRGQFSDISADFEIKFFYQTSAMKIPIVPKYSAVVPEMPNAEEIPIEADHRHMVKYKSLDDENFCRVASRLVTMTKSARTKTARKWESWQRVKSAATHRTSDYYETTTQQKQFQIPLEVKHWRNKKFVGREDILSHLSTKLFNSSSREAEVMVLHGTGGIGKTQIALESSGSIEQTVINGLRDAISRIVLHYEFLGLKSQPTYSVLKDSLSVGDAESFDAIRARQTFGRWLSLNAVNTWLLVFDNVDDLESFNVKDFIPMCSGLDPGLSYHSAEITELAEHDGLKMIENYAGITLVTASQEHKYAEELIATLGQLPLAIAQAGVFKYQVAWDFDKVHGNISTQPWIPREMGKCLIHLEKLKDAKAVHMEALSRISMCDDNYALVVAWDVASDLIIIGEGRIAQQGLLSALKLSFQRNDVIEDVEEQARYWQSLGLTGQAQEL